MELWLLFLLLLWGLWETQRYLEHRKRIVRWRSQRRLSAPVRDQWNLEHQAAVLQLDLHLQLAQGLAPYESGAQSVLRPHYKPLLYYGLLRTTHEASYALARWCGWRCEDYQGVWFWTRGSGPLLLFLHGFGFGPYAYGRILHGLSKEYRVIAPQYPGLSYDGRVEVPLIQDYARTVHSYLGPRKYSIISNSFGSIVHHALLRELGTSAPSQVQHQIYVEPVCFYPYAGQLFSFVELSWLSCLRAPTWKASAIATLSYLLVAKDATTLYLCQQILEDPKWDGELYLSSIPTVVVLSEYDSLIRVPELRDYLLHRYPSTVQVIVLPGICHGEAMFAQGAKINLHNRV